MTEIEALDKLEECANGMKDLPKSNWIDLAENEAELDLKIMGWVETIKFELFKGKQVLTELQAIKDSKPSEALEKVNKVLESCYEYEKKTGKNAIVHISKEPLIEIQQSLLKAQEQEKELKQKEALEFMLKRILTSAKAHFAGDDEIFKISLTIIDNSELANYLKEILKNER
ncbi:MAG: hypothetical protein K6G28_02020 [Acholeplasmatales bacterium]|nr:hypothetical protein [Acholeplasmatales bacterium]